MGDVLAQYGWIGVLVIFAIDKVWPWVAKTFSSERANALKVEEEERKFRREQTERQTAAMERMAHTQVETNLRLTYIEHGMNELLKAAGVLPQVKQ